jgi:hypothetical protein
MAEKPGVPLTTVLASMMQIHVHAPYLLNHALETLLRGHGMPPATLSISPIMSWSAAAINILPTPPAKRRWII